ncbi:MAG: lycopene cyclase family protein [Saprospiraceae bacterium]|nr:lycopene cyclase [Lewinellaceae bacterium]
MLLEHQKFDIILAGAGLSGLSLAVEMARRPGFRQKKILLLDRDRKQKNDRTWCFWATEADHLPPVVFRSWEHCRFYAPGFEKNMRIAPFRYHMVRGIDFYNWVFDQLDRHPNITRINTNISAIDAHQGVVFSEAGAFSAQLIFNSAFTHTPIMPRPSEVYPQVPFSDDRLVEKNKSRLEVEYGPLVRLLQHFKGWVVKAPPGTFDAGAMTFMDFRIPQHGETRFVYVLPLSDAEALVEFTVFSPALLALEIYDDVLRNYLSEFLGLKSYSVQDEEFGVIPMTNFPFPSGQDGRVINIGTAGGFVKASSGYAFKRTLQKIERFVDSWEHTGQPDPELLVSPWSFRAFDSIFLQVLQSQNELGAEIFTSLFKKLPPALVLRFLDEQSTFAENLRLVSAPPPGPFLRALVQQMPMLFRL